MKKSKKPPLYVKVSGVSVNGRPTCEYFRVTGKRRVRITYTEFYSSAPCLRSVAHRRQGGKRGVGEVPGAGHCWPMKCEALAVHPSQVEQMNERNKKHGVNVQYEPKHGLAVIPDEAAYRRLRKLEGVHHNNSYNG